MDTSKMKLVKLQNSAKTHLTKENIIEMVVQTICAIPNYEKLKNDPELFRYILALLQNGVKDSSIDQKDLIDKIVVRIFPNMSDLEKSTVENIIAFVINNELIQKVGMFSMLKKWVKSKVLGSDPEKKA